jgi:hypothetical protein
MRLHRGVVDVGVWRRWKSTASATSTRHILRDESGNVSYFNGSAGGNDTASLAKRGIVIMHYNKLRLRQALAHVTSLGFVDGRGSQELALGGKGPYRLITDCAVIRL